MEDKKNLNPMSEDALDETTGGATNFDFYGNPIGGGGGGFCPSATIPTTPVNPVPNWSNPAPVTYPGLNFSVTNSSGAVYVCPSCGGNRFKVKKADENNITLQCKSCGTRFTVANA